MHNILENIPDRILRFAEGALAQANQHAVFADPGNEHWDFMSVVNAAHAGELFLKAIIAKEHPLLVFKDVFSLDDGTSEFDLEKLIARGRTHDFEKLPQVLWVTTGRRIPEPSSYEAIRKLRNSVQHFCADEKHDFRSVALSFLYENIDPLIRDVFGLYAIKYHEDHGVGYDYVVGSLVRREIRFSLPDDFTLNEIDLLDEAKDCSLKYRNWLKKECSRIGRADLFS